MKNEGEGWRGGRWSRGGKGEREGWGGGDWLPDQ